MTGDVGVIAQSWTARYDAELDEVSVRSAFQPAEKYRVSRYRYPAGTIMNGSMIRGTCVVLRGQCSFSFEQSVRLRAGQFAELPGGPYELVADGDTDLELVLAWQLPQIDQPST